MTILLISGVGGCGPQPAPRLDSARARPAPPPPAPLADDEPDSEESPAPPEADAGRPLGEGVASYYGGKFHGRRTASGERFDKTALTAAHRNLPFGTCVRVVHAENGRSVKVRINDRGPFSRKRVIDVSEAAARALGMLQDGVARVRLFSCDP